MAAKRELELISKPVLRRQVEVKSEFAIRLLTRGVWNTVGALYRIDTIWRMIGKDEEIDQMESLVASYLNGAVLEIDEELDRLGFLLEQHGVEDLPDYTQKRQVPVRILSPFIATYVSLILKTDAVVQRLDALWLAGFVSSLERKRKMLYLVARLRKMRAQIRRVERRTRDLALRRGKKEALETKVQDAEVVEQDALEKALA